MKQQYLKIILKQIIYRSRVFNLQQMSMKKIFELFLFIRAVNFLNKLLIFFYIFNKNDSNKTVTKINSHQNIIFKIA